MVEGLAAPVRLLAGDFEQDATKNAIQIVADGYGLKPDDADALFSEECGADAVMLHLRVLFVSGTIDFDRQLCGGAIEVEDLGLDRVLAAEFDAFQLLTFQFTP